MEIAVKAAVLGAVAAIGAALIKKSNPELSLMLSVAVIVCMAAAAIKLVSGIVDVVNTARDMSGISAAVFTPVLKCVGIGIAAKICADICRDASESGIASAVELAGSVAAVYVALPLISTLMKMIGEMI